MKNNKIESIIEERKRIEKVLAKEKNLDKISFYEGYLKGLRFNGQEMYEEGYRKGDEDAYEQIEIDEAEQAHITEQGWCCACPADMMLLEEKIEETEKQTKQQLIKEIEDWMIEDRYYEKEEILNKLNKIK